MLVRYGSDVESLCRMAVAHQGVPYREAIMHGPLSAQDY